MKKSFNCSSKQQSKSKQYFLNPSVFTHLLEEFTLDVFSAVSWSLNRMKETEWEHGALQPWLLDNECCAVMKVCLVPYGSKISVCSPFLEPIPQCLMSWRKTLNNRHSLVFFLIQIRKRVHSSAGMWKIVAGLPASAQVGGGGIMQLLKLLSLPPSQKTSHCVAMVMKNKWITPTKTSHAHWDVTNRRLLITACFLFQCSDFNVLMRN